MLEKDDVSASLVSKSRMVIEVFGRDSEMVRKVRDGGSLSAAHQMAVELKEKYQDIIAICYVKLQEEYNGTEEEFDIFMNSIKWPHRDEGMLPLVETYKRLVKEK